MFFISIYQISFHSTLVDSENIIPRILTAEVSAAIQSVRFIANHIKNADADNEVSFVHISKNLFKLQMLPLLYNTLLPQLSFICHCL